jgi:hypothetical protein
MSPCVYVVNASIFRVKTEARSSSSLYTTSEPKRPRLETSLSLHLHVTNEKTRSFTLKDKRRLRYLKKRILRKIFGPTGEEMPVEEKN